MSASRWYQPCCSCSPRLVPGLLVFTVPSPVASALVLRLDLSGYRDSAAGRYVPAHMPLSMQAIRSLSASRNRIGCDQFGSIASMTDAAGSGWSRWTITSAGSSGVAPQAKGGEDRATMWPNRKAAVTRRIHNY